MGSGFVPQHMQKQEGEARVCGERRSQVWKGSRRSLELPGVACESARFHGLREGPLDKYRMQRFNNHWLWSLGAEVQPLPDQQSNVEPEAWLSSGDLQRR